MLLFTAYMCARARAPSPETRATLVGGSQLKFTRGFSLEIKRQVKKREKFSKRAYDSSTQELLPAFKSLEEEKTAEIFKLLPGL